MNITHSRYQPDNVTEYLMHVTPRTADLLSEFIALLELLKLLKLLSGPMSHLIVLSEHRTVTVTNLRSQDPYLSDLIVLS